MFLVRGICCLQSQESPNWCLETKSFVSRRSQLFWAQTAVQAPDEARDCQGQSGKKRNTLFFKRLEWNSMIDFTHCCVCGHSHILFCLGVNSLAHVGFSLICILTGNIRTCNSKSFACALDFIGEQEKLFNYEGLTHYYIIVCTKSIRMSHDCPEMVKRYSFNKARMPHETLSSSVPQFSSSFDSSCALRWAKIHYLPDVCNKCLGIHSSQGLLVWGDVQLFLHLLSPFL